MTRVQPMTQEQARAWDLLNARQLLELNLLFKKHEQERADLKARQREDRGSRAERPLRYRA